MEIKKILFRKSMKFLTLLLTSLLIMTVSAYVYTYMYIQGTITVGAATLIWEEGPGAKNVTLNIAAGNTTATITINVLGYGAPVNFTEVLYLTNVPHIAVSSIEIKVTEAAGDGDFTEAKMHIWTNQTGSWTYIASADNPVNLDSLGDSYTGSMSAIDVGWLMTFEIDAVDASPSDGSFTIQVKY